MRSASARSLAGLVALLAASGLLLLGAMSGCATTQETAARKQAESKRILEAREARREQRSESDDKGSKKDD